MQLDISYDKFIRTTDARHEAVVKALLARVWDTDVRKAAYRARYCVGCEEFKDDDDLDEDGNCLIHRTPCPEREEVRPPLRIPHPPSPRNQTPAGAACRLTLPPCR